MKLYWRDRNGLPPPKEAKFALFPFFPHQKRPFLDHIERVQELPPPTKPISILKQHFLPSQNNWHETLIKAIASMNRDHFEKVVLARSCIIECAFAPDPFAIAAKLAEKSNGATIFCLADGDEAFIGATPELLFSREKKIIRSEALAGTLKRGKAPKEDLLLEKELLACPKMNGEFLPVQTYIENRLSPLCKFPLKHFPLHVRKTPTVQHLCSQFEGELRDGATDFDLITNLHPTPALAGLPQTQALHWIAENEPFDRKYYGSTLGWWTEDASSFAVAIRCCHIKGTQVEIFTGAGITRLSDPAKEWEELNHKIALYKDIFV